MPPPVHRGKNYHTNMVKFANYNSLLFNVLVVILHPLYAHTNIP